MRAAFEFGGEAARRGWGSGAGGRVGRRRRRATGGGGFGKRRELGFTGRVGPKYGL